MNLNRRAFFFGMGKAAAVAAATPTLALTIDASSARPDEVDGMFWQWRNMEYSPFPKAVLEKLAEAAKMR